MKIEAKLVANLHEKEQYFIHMKQELNHVSVLKKGTKSLKFNKKASL